MKLEDATYISTWHDDNGEVAQIKYGPNFEVASLPYTVPHLKISFTLTWTEEEDIPDLVPIHIISPNGKFLYNLSQEPQKHSLKHRVNFDFRPFRFDDPGIYKITFSDFPSKSVSTDTEAWIQVHRKA